MRSRSGIIRIDGANRDLVAIATLLLASLRISEDNTSGIHSLEALLRP